MKNIYLQSCRWFSRGLIGSDFRGCCKKRIYTKISRMFVAQWKWWQWISLQHMVGDAMLELRFSSLLCSGETVLWWFYSSWVEYVWCFYYSWFVYVDCAMKPYTSLTQKAGTCFSHYKKKHARRLTTQSNLLNQQLQTINNPKSLTNSNYKQLTIKNQHARRFPRVSAKEARSE